MASHFKQPEDAGGRDSRGRGGTTPRRSAGSQGAHLKVRRGGDESYHAPEGNPYAASTPHSADAHYIPVVSGAPVEGRRRSHFAETDPYDLSGRRSRDPKKRVGRIVSVILFVVGVGLIAMAACMWLYNQWNYHQQDVLNEKLATYADVSDNGTTPPQVDWEALKAINDEVVGWVQIPGTVVSYPVYQAADNEKYLTTGADGSSVIGGQIFMDCENTAPGMVDGQTIIYGHHLRNGAMFKAVSDMTNQEMFDSVSTVWYVTEEATYELEPLLIYQTDASDTNARQFTFGSDEELRAYLTELLGRAAAQSPDAEALISQASHVLTLCTCNYDYSDNGRTLLVCVPKVADGE